MQKTRGISAISFLVGLNVVIYLLLAWVFISPKQTCGFDSYAKDAIPNLVRQVYLSSDSALKENEEFFKGDEIFPRDAIGASPINLTAVTFVCTRAVILTSCPDRGCRGVCSTSKNHDDGGLGARGVLAVTAVVANRAQTKSSPSLLMKLVSHRLGLFATVLLVREEQFQPHQSGRTRACEDEEAITWRISPAGQPLPTLASPPFG